MRRPLVLAAVLAASVWPAPHRLAVAGEPPGRAVKGPVATAAEGVFEDGRLLSTEDAIRGPFVVTYLAPGAEVQLVRQGVGNEVIGAVSGPLAQPLPLAPNVSLRLAAPGDVAYAGYRPMPITRPLEAWMGRPIWVAAAGGPPEQWTLREIGADYVVVDRTRTYRVLPLRRISEITWTDLTGIDPTPRILLSRE